MASVHFLNVCPGDCTIIQHASGRVTMVDICDGNTTQVQESLSKALGRIYTGDAIRGNFRMCETPTNPISYVQSTGLGRVFRFILSHPDMDHMDGFDALNDKIGIDNFWDSGVRRPKPSFDGSPYLEEDWDRYVRVRDGREPGVTSLQKLDGAQFKFANRGEDGQGGGDGLHILAPNNELLFDPDEEDDLNDSSYVLLYRSIGGRILLPGDAHDLSWEHVIRNHRSDISNCSILLAPHHGRDSDRSYDFLDVVRPKLTIIGCSPSKYIDYDQWHRRKLPFITSNQAGNIVAEIDSSGMDIYIENEQYAAKLGAHLHVRNLQGYVHIGRIPAEAGTRQGAIA